MGTANINGQTVTFPDGPYTYDDPRFVYDERCMFYDGGFSAICLLPTILPRRVGKSTGRKVNVHAYAQQVIKREKDCEVELEVTIRLTCAKINNKEFTKQKHDVALVKKYRLRYKPMKVSLLKIKQNKNEFDVHLLNIASTITVPKICISDPNIKLLPIKTIVSGSKSRIKQPKILLKTESIKKKK